MKTYDDYKITSRSTKRGRKTAFFFPTEVERDAFEAGVNFVNDSYLEVTRENTEQGFILRILDRGETL